MSYLKKIALLIVLMTAGFSSTAMAQVMLGEIRWVGFNFTPRGWASCNGQLLPISQHNALFSLLGTMYGGDGRTTFALPDLQGRVMISTGRGPGLSTYRQGQKGGQEQVTLITSQTPSHNHSLVANAAAATSTAPNNRALAAKDRTNLYSDAAADTQLHSSSIGNTGGSQAHENRPPYLTLQCIIAIDGVYPSRS